RARGTVASEVEGEARDQAVRRGVSGREEVPSADRVELDETRKLDLETDGRPGGRRWHPRGGPGAERDERGAGEPQADRGKPAALGPHRRRRPPPRSALQVDGREGVVAAGEAAGRSRRRHVEHEPDVTS